MTAGDKNYKVNVAISLIPIEETVLADGTTKTQNLHSLIDKGIGWLSDYNLALPSVIAVNVWKGIPNVVGFRAARAHARGLAPVRQGVDAIAPPGRRSARSGGRPSRSGPPPPTCTRRSRTTTRTPAAACFRTSRSST